MRRLLAIECPPFALQIETKPIEPKHKIRPCGYENQFVSSLLDFHLDMIGPLCYLAVLPKQELCMLQNTTDILRVLSLTTEVSV